MKIGVFDSGVGGKSVTLAIQRALPGVEIIYEEDHANLPYGNKEPDELFRLVLPILNKLSESGCDVIVIACNTVSTTIADRLKNEISTPLVTIVPMVKTASALTKTRIITVCATPLTLRSPRYAQLKAEFGGGITFYEPDVSDWALLIENNTLDEVKIRAMVDESLAHSSDVIVLGCTHYHWIYEIIASMVGDRAVILQPETAVVAQLKRVIAQLG